MISKLLVFFNFGIVSYKEYNVIIGDMFTYDTTVFTGIVVVPTDRHTIMNIEINYD